MVTCKFTSCSNGYYNGYDHGYYSTDSVTVTSWLSTHVHLRIRHSLQSTQHNIDILSKQGSTRIHSKVLFSVIASFKM